ncbi:MAG: NRDE family protein [Deltaproteobacteria bacterium]|nr:NRDE family protein [Deltaproteobacteria bacterium]
MFGVAEVPLVVAANRDELYARRTRAPEVLAPGVAGGVDEESGGTWLAVHRDGRFAAVTNQRAIMPKPPGVRSRGLVVRELISARDPDAYVAAIDPRQYASMNLMWGDAERVRVAYLRHEGASEIIELPHGIHTLCNDRMDAGGFARCDRVREHLPHAWDPAGLRAVLADHTTVEGRESHLPADIARALTAACIHTEHYGTRSSSLVAIDHGRTVAYLHADGPPCVTEYRDRMELLRA